MLLKKGIKLARICMAGCWKMVLRGTRKKQFQNVTACTKVIISRWKQISQLCEIVVYHLRLCCLISDPDFVKELTKQVYQMTVTCVIFMMGHCIKVIKSFYLSVQLVIGMAYWWYRGMYGMYWDKEMVVFCLTSWQDCNIHPLQGNILQQLLTIWFQPSSSLQTVHSS